MKTWNYEEYQLEIGKFLGSGTTGKVYKCYSREMIQDFVLKTPHGSIFDKNIANEVRSILYILNGGDFNRYLKEFGNRLRLSEIIRMAIELAAKVRYLYNYKEEIIHELSSHSPLKVNNKDFDKYLNTPRMQENLDLVSVSGTHTTT
ncbi:hypothetical protein F8M41_015395 [Gigaspora margarita]|uniref:Protein kinase domain-containing protein n=1 Tax=Gigaspora margarita TaxID=4874 RepID=A0A8H4ENI4_GIGMA|nr:hypothetical protein F8M41_015395 [Gigaspora margarita]